jgi:accessory gene regulator protein AgrB
MIKNNTISNLFLFSVYTEIIMILPFTYHLFHLPYNNYKNYVMSYNT